MNHAKRLYANFRLLLTFSLIIVFTSSIITPSYAHQINSFNESNIELLDEFTLLYDDGDTISLLGRIDTTTVIASFSRSTGNATKTSVVYEGNDDHASTRLLQNIYSTTFQLQICIDSFDFNSPPSYRGLYLNSRYVSILLNAFVNCNYSRTSIIVGTLLAVIIGRVLFATIVATVATIVIGGATYVIATAVAQTLMNNSRNYVHHSAIMELNSHSLFIGNGISNAQARSRISIGLDVWSHTSANARAAIPGAAEPFPQIHGAVYDHRKSGQFFNWHWHPTPRTGAHSFFGLPLPNGHGQH